MPNLLSAIRQIQKAPSFAVVVILTIALGIGANTAIFTLVHAVLLRSLPVRDPQGLYEIGDNTRPGMSDGYPDPNNNGDFSLFSYDLYEQIRATTPQLTEVAAMSAPDITMDVREGKATTRAERVEYVSGNYFDLLGISPFIGRLLGLRDNHMSSAPAAVLSYAAWQSFYGGNPTIVGKTLTLRGHAFTVIGVAPSGFFGDRIDPKPPSLWIPLETEPMLDGPQMMLHTASMNWLDLLARARPATNMRALEGQMSTNLQHWMSSVPAYTENGLAVQIPRQHIHIIPGGRGILVLQSKREDGLYLLMGICLLVLLVSCANVANLLLARGVKQRQGIALRMALGAIRRRMVAQMMTESLVLACMGGLAGLAVAYGGTRLILLLAFPYAPQLPIDPHPAMPVLLFALALSLATGVAFGILPAWINSNADPAEALRGANRSTHDQGAPLQKSLIVLQTTLSLVLLVCAGLLTRSLAHVQHQDLGLATRNRYVVQFDPQAAGYALSTLPDLYRDIEQRFATVPGLKNVAVASYAPLDGSTSATGVYIPGRRDAADNGDNMTLYDRVSPQYFAAIGQRLVSGRVFTMADTESSQRVAVVNQAFARRYYPGQNPIGDAFGPNEPQMATAIRIVGIVTDAKYSDPHRSAEPMFFVPLPQHLLGYNQPSDIEDEDRSMFAGTLILNFMSSPADVARSVRASLIAINPNLAPSSVLPFSYTVGGNFDEDRMLSRLTMLFSALALVVAAVGLYGITAYQVERRTSEIGIRMALGAKRADMVLMVLRATYIQVGLGVVVGLPMAILGAHAIRNQLYETRALDPLSVLVAVAALACAATVAVIVPAHRAASIEPITALRSE